jgi:hypothetical protein
MLKGAFKQTGYILDFIIKREQKLPNILHSRNMRVSEVMTLGSAQLLHVNKTCPQLHTWD